MFLIQVTLIEGLLTSPQKQELVARLTDALVATAGEHMRRDTWCLLEEIPEREWGVGGETVALDDVRAMARGTDGGG